MKTITEFLVKKHVKKIEYNIVNYIENNKSLFILLVDQQKSIDIIEHICNLLPSYKNKIEECYKKAKKRYGDNCSFAIQPAIFNNESISYLAEDIEKLNNPDKYKKYQQIISDVKFTVDKNGLLKCFNMDNWQNIKKYKI